MADLIERLVEQDDAFKRARVRALVDLETGFDLGSEGWLSSRESAYDR